MAECVAKNDPLPIVDNPRVHEIFVTGAAGLEILDGVVGITLEAIRYDHSKAPALATRQVVGRLIIPVPGAQNLALALYNFLQQHGADPSNIITTAGDPAMPQ